MLTPPMEKASILQRCIEETRQLHTLFYRTFDHARCLQLASRLHENQSIPGVMFIGSGTFFSTHRIDSDLVIKIPHLPNPKSLSHWLQQWKKLQSFSVPLLPPFSCIEHAQMGFFLCMPYGEAILAPLAPHWSPLTPHIEIFLRTCAAQKMICCDNLDLVQQHGIPFVCDLSDLIPQRYL